MARSDGLEDVLTHDPTYEPPVITARQLELLIEKKYLNIPLRNGAAKRNMTIKIDGRLLGEFQTPLARSEPDYYGFFTYTLFRGEAPV